nr:nuclear transport factor 2 family protein [uncultured Actinoplanes sp.]
MEPVVMVQRMYSAANERDFDAVEDIFAPDFYSHPLRQSGVEPIRSAWRTIAERFPRLRVTPHRMIAAGDRVAVWSAIENVPGEPEMMELIRVDKGRIVELWGLSNLSWRSSPSDQP